MKTKNILFAGMVAVLPLRSVTVPAQAQQVETQAGAYSLVIRGFDVSNCATVEAINVVEVNGEGSYLGAIGGGVVGALVGSQVGGGKGRTAAEVAGAVGGAYAGRNIERNARKTHHYEVVVRFPNGGSQTLSYENDPGLRVGEKVKVNNGVLERDTGVQ